MQKVTVTNQDTAFQRLVTSGKDGMFLVPGLPAGPYEVRAEAKGFRTLIQTTTVRTGNSSRVELLLPIVVLQQLVEAMDRIPPLDYDKHGVAGVVSRFQIENLPLNGREFLRLAVLEPGVAAAPSAGYFSRQFDVSVMSAPAERTRTTMDGGPIYGPATGGTPQNFSQEVVREFQISTVNFDLSTGLTGSGAINVATRYGGNDYHGSGFFFFRDHNMAAYPALRREPTNQDPFFARRQAGLRGRLYRGELGPQLRHLCVRHHHDAPARAAAGPAGAGAASGDLGRWQAPGCGPGRTGGDSRVGCAQRPAALG